MTAVDEPACLVRDVVVRRTLAGDREITILDGVSLDARAGELLCLRGRSGSGKTTLLHVIAGLLRPERGRVVCTGLDVWAASDSARAEMRRSRLTLVPQDAGLMDSLTAGENVLLSTVGRGRSRRSAGRDAQRVLQSVGLGERGASLPRNLSMGERQRVGFARALLGDSAVIVADEPTASLDRASADTVIALIVELAHTHGSAVIVASHDPAVALAADVVFDLPDR